MLKQGAKKVLRSIGLTRPQFAAGRMALERATLSALPSGRVARSGGRILAYHSVGQPRTGVNDVSPKQFERHLDQALELGFEFVPARAIAASGGHPKQLAITFDDAWTSVASNVAPVLRERDIPWSLFVVSGWSDHVDQWTRDDILSWRDIEALLGEDLELGSHSVTHPDFATLKRPGIKTELEVSRDRIREKLGILPETFAIPYGQSNNWTAEAVAMAQVAGYETVYAQAEHTRYPGTIPRTFITKFDNDRIFRAALDGAFDNWEEWV